MRKKIRVVIEIVTILGLIVAAAQLIRNEITGREQAIAIATQIAVLQKQLDVQCEMATLQARTLKSESTATAVAARMAELQSTAVALATMQAEVKATTSPSVPISPPLKQTGTPTLPPAIRPTFVSNIDGMVMAYVPAGEFLMGSASSDSLADKDEIPQHTVYLDAFWIDRTEVSNKQYSKCVLAQRCEASEYIDDPNFSGDNQPVVGIDWDNAQAYCRWAGRQLPTEAQWEKAARGTDGRIYPWGNQTATCDYAVLNDGSRNGCGTGATWPVGSKPKGASPYGVLDVAGNALEWVTDWYAVSYYASSPLKNPLGPAFGQYRVLRGGSFSYDARLARSTSRNWYRPDSNFWDRGGIRCILRP